MSKPKIHAHVPKDATVTSPHAGWSRFLYGVGAVVLGLAALGMVGKGEYGGADVIGFFAIGFGWKDSTKTIER